jgi:hypothetical protein
MKKFRDIEQLSSYLDGQLNPSESARLESRLAADTELASAFNDLRAARSILRKLPSRKAPRNFTLTRQMVGLKPPLPRSYAFFRFSTALATVLFVLTFAANALSQTPLIGADGGAFATGRGGGGGASESAAAPVEAPAAMSDATEAPAAAAPALEMQPMPTLSADFAATEAPAAKSMVTSTPELLAQPLSGNSIPPEMPTETVPQEQSYSQSQPLIPFTWQVVLFAFILVSGLTAFLLRRSASRKWK